MHAAVGLSAAGRLATAAAALLRRRRLARRVPRAPYTLAVIAAYLYAASMPDAFAGLSVLLPRVRNRRIAKATRGRTYSAESASTRRCSMATNVTAPPPSTLAAGSCPAVCV